LINFSATHERKEKNYQFFFKYPGAGRGVPEVIVLDPAGQKNTVPVKIRQTSPDEWRCEYVSTAIGLHSVNVFFAGQPIPNSPFGVKVSAGNYFWVTLTAPKRRSQNAHQQNSAEM
jgi:hypothetical protein